MFDMTVKEFLPLLGVFVALLGLGYSIFKDRRQDKKTKKEEELSYKISGEERTLKYAFELMDELKNEVERLRAVHSNCSKIIDEYDQELTKLRRRARELERQIDRESTGIQEVKPYGSTGN